MNWNAMLYETSISHSLNDINRLVRVFDAISSTPYLAEPFGKGFFLDDSVFTYITHPSEYEKLIKQAADGWDTLGVELKKSISGSNVRISEKKKKFMRSLHLRECNPASVLSVWMSYVDTKTKINSVGRREREVCWIVSEKRESVKHVDYETMMNARVLVTVPGMPCAEVCPLHPFVGGVALNVCFSCSNKMRGFRSFASAYAREKGLMANYKYTSLMSLRRCRIYTGYCDIGSSFSYALSLLHYLTSLEDPLMDNLCSALINGVNRVQQRVPQLFVDDAVRSYLQKLDKCFFSECSNSSSISYIISCLHGVSTMGGPRSWNKEQVFTSICDWVSEKDESLRSSDALKIEQELVDLWMNKWVTSKVGTTVLSFDSFCDDLVKWATSGGGPKSELDVAGEKHKLKTKWAWGFMNLSQGKKIYDEALKMPCVARVALKEEAKTRTVITTPMASYLRQCYMLYIFGDPDFLDSTVGSTHHVQMLAPTRSPYYICVDASKFDHCVSKRFIRDVYLAMRRSLTRWHLDLGMDVLIDEEIKELDKLVVEFDGKQVPYEGGLLSGWKLTSFLGSLKSDLLCEYINRQLGLRMRKVVQGDDIIMLSDVKIPVDVVCSLCDEFGIKTNPLKTTVSDVGEFLKYRYGPKVISAYPSRCVRTIFMANPWLDASVVITPGTVMTKWFTLGSRLSVCLNSTSVAKRAIDLGVLDVRSWSGGALNVEEIVELLKTPSSAGGLGVVETMDIPDCSSFKIRCIESPLVGMPHERQFLVSIGVLPPPTQKRVVVKTKDVNVTLFTDFSNVNWAKMDRVVDKFSVRRGCNTFKTMLALFLHHKESDILRLAYNNSIGMIDLRVFDDSCFPMYLRKTREYLSRIKFILFPDEVTVPGSLYLDNKFSKNLTRYFINFSRTLMSAARVLTVSRTRSLAMTIAREYLRYRTVIHSV
uniref:RNA-directed RNA polymerase n=1 Tax=Embera virus TaxID=2689337 RepID=A0A6B9KNG3_9VIRU|nr:RdRp [Embera virus]